MAIVEVGSLSTGQFVSFGPYQLVPGGVFLATLYFTGDLDLYGRFNFPPTTSAYNYIRNFGNSVETLFFQTYTSELFYVGINGWNAGTYHLTVEATYAEDPVLGLTADEKGQITFHLKQAGINFLPEMLTISYSLDELTLIRAALTRVGQAYDQTLLNYEIKLGVDQNQTVQDLQTEVVRPDSTTTTTYGDRTITNYRYLSYSQRVSAYHREVEQLAIALGVI